MNSDIPLTCPRPLGGRGHLTLARGDSTMRSFVICFAVRNTLCECVRAVGFGFFEKKPRKMPRVSSQSVL